MSTRASGPRPTAQRKSQSRARGERGHLPLGMHLVGSLPLWSAEETFRTVSEVAGTRLRRIPDGETGPRSDWIVWQYPVLSSRPEFEVAPPAPDAYRHLPRLRIRDGADRSGLAFGSLGYAAAAESSYREFARLKLEGVIPGECRFEVSLPTPLVPVSAFVGTEDQAVVEQAYEARLMEELDEIIACVPKGQLAIQWCTSFEFLMLEGLFPVWFPDVKGGIVERLLRISRRVPPEVELGFHLCYGDSQRGLHREPDDLRLLVEMANVLAGGMGRPLNWVHMPVRRAAADRDYFAPLANLRLGDETELYLGVVHQEDGVAGATQRIEAAQSVVKGPFGIATECGWGRRPRAQVADLLKLHTELCRPVSKSASHKPFAWPDGVVAIPDEEWVSAPVDTFGLSYDVVDGHGWYENLDPTVEQLTRELRDGDILIDYSGGTGILLNRLRRQVFDRKIGMLIADSSPKFLRVAVDHFEGDPRVAFRVLRYLKEEKRLQFIDEVLDQPLIDRKVDALASTNAIHLYTNLDETLASWARVLRPGGKVFINSGNLRNLRAAPNEWILDETVYVVHEVAVGIVLTDPRFAAYREVLDDEERLTRHLAFRDRVFLPPRPLSLYTSALENAGFEVTNVSEKQITATIDDWFDLLKAYHEPVLGWVGGSEKIDGVEPTAEAIDDRLALIRQALDVIFGGRPDFRCCWTYIEAQRS